MDIIIGGGEYGNTALEKLIEENRPVIVIDEDLECKACQSHNLTVISGSPARDFPEEPAEYLPIENIRINPAGKYFMKGGIKTAAKIISENPHIERIFPTAPVHVSAGIIAHNAGFMPDPNGAEEITKLLPQKLITGRKYANIYCSLNPERACIPNCPEPPICPVTKERRETPLWSMMAEILRDRTQATKKPPVHVIQSRQYGPGLGYIAATDITYAINSAESHNKLWIATACKCHGVITALKRTPTE